MADFKIYTTTPSKVYFGTSEVKKIYWGTIEVWSSNYWAPYIEKTTAVGVYSDLIFAAQVATAGDTDTPMFVHCVGGNNFYITDLNDDSNFRNALNDCTLMGLAPVMSMSSTSELESSWLCDFREADFFYVFVPDSSNPNSILGYIGEAV